ncbi:probable LRR receptor-like serine/threonine-protein kinase IRK [Cucurbita pepo subsp. pepo]|uniref:probable LRR receptor-like serine/threonine-protein kinase IRK n=1 Tax=Cucurbita pepo subsp. pepo TaxID=3664 RepID=UPI000C9D565F|nr:probable LRR receptor-like serine/threonine-protein kinase IRK [Cucurbita pepo subsp. pepo]XP_023532293.1 probable LRR receptor-like serine/threonine-protein kinase IRK [Cucurbita pepo subsp. pepo]
MRALLKMKRLLELFVLFVLAPLCARCLNLSLNDDVLGLIVFKAAVEDPKQNLATWDEDDDSPCNWTGVQCSPRSKRVVELNLDGFSLSGRLGRGLFQLEFLQRLSLSKNNLSGNLSPNFARVDNLQVIDLSGNNLSGTVPDDFFRQCGSLRVVSLANNKFDGKVPDSLSSCGSLIAVNLSSNQFSGPLPSGILSLSGLRSLDLSDNALVGEIPKVIENLYNLRTLNLRKNRFSAQIPDGIGSCLLLRSIDLSENSFSGNLPQTMQKLVLCSDLILSRNLFEGNVPEWIGEMKGLETLDFSGNNFTGHIPTTMGNLQYLKVLNLSSNGFTDSFPESVMKCQNLLAIDISHNFIMGNLQAIGSLAKLQFLNLSGNSFVGPIPETIGDLKALSVLDLSRNRLNESIPEAIGGAVSLMELKLDENFLGGELPSSIGHCSSLTTLFTSHNNLTGPIPVELAKLTYLRNLDLSFNNLNGTLPKQLSNLPNLLLFNISHNDLKGELPGGVFFNTISPSSVAGNPSLCGSVVNKSCPSVLPKPIVLDPNSTSDSISSSLPPSTNLRRNRNILSISALVAIGAAAFIIIGIILITILNSRVQPPTSSLSAAALALSIGDDFSHSSSPDANSGKLVVLSGELDFSAGAHALLNKDCELGCGGFGAVYHTVLRDGHSVAIKKLTVSSLVKSQEDFEREVRKFGNVRHQNLVTLEGYYWTPSLQLLIYEYVSGGSLYGLLHEASDDNVLPWNERFNIILGTAKGLAHLHQSNTIHYNIKSSNILIDCNGHPKVGDYGLARLLPMLDRYVLSSKIQSALGYMAPEFACRTVKITEKCDMYAFGILILEIVTGKRPVEYMEDDVAVLCDMVRVAVDEGRAEECIDSKLRGNFPAEEAVPVLKLGLICTSHVPSNRPEMREMVKILEMIKCPSELQELG